MFLLILLYFLLRKIFTLLGWDLTNPRNNTKPVIRAKANRVATGKTTTNPATGKEEAEYRFEHAGWERVVKIEVVVEAL